MTIGVFICLGHEPLVGCGRVLTDNERHYYGNCCECCERAWCDAISAWRRGADNPDFDAMFDGPPPSKLN